MTTLLTQTDAQDIVESELIANGIDTEIAVIMAEGLLSGLIVGYVMDAGAFYAIHGARLPHLTRLALKAAGRPVTPQPGDAPRNI